MHVFAPACPFLPPLTRKQTFNAYMEFRLDMDVTGSDAGLVRLLNNFVEWTTDLTPRYRWGFKTSPGMIHVRAIKWQLLLILFSMKNAPGDYLVHFPARSWQWFDPSVASIFVSGELKEERGWRSALEN